MFWKSLHHLARVARTPFDPNGINNVDETLLDELAPAAELFGRLFFRMEVEGLDRIPKGRALLVGNHNAGITFLEPFALMAQWYLRREKGERVYALAHDVIMKLPLLANVLASFGAVRACHQNAATVFRGGHKVIVFPGGNLEAFRPFRDRHRIVFGGRKGFIRLALREGVPIVPIVFQGGHSTFLVLHDGQFLAKGLALDKLLRSETCPIFLGLPWGLAVGPLFHIPLPVRSRIRILPPLNLHPYGPQDADDPLVLQRIYDDVTGRMQSALGELASRYPSGQLFSS